MSKEIKFQYTTKNSIKHKYCKVNLNTIYPKFLLSGEQAYINIKIVKMFDS